MAASCLDDPGAKSRPDVVEVLVDSGLGENVKRGQSSGRGHRISAEGAGRPGSFGERAGSRGELLHYFRPTDDSRQRETAGHSLSISGKIRNDAVPLLGASPGYSETGDNFIEYEDYSVPGRYVANRLEKAGFG